MDTIRHCRRFGFALIACASFASVHADCRQPVPPTKVPDAAVATEQEMVEAMRTLNRYNADVVNYTKCLMFEMREKRLSPDVRAVKHNLATDMYQSTAQKFNEQVRLFKARSSEPLNAMTSGR
jgi:hypothetical protein